MQSSRPLKANEAWKKAVEACLQGEAVSPRKADTVEVLFAQNVIDMNFPVVTLAQRRLNYRFMAAEAWWILRGSNRVDEIVPYCSALSKFTDNGVIFSGAYGPPISEQMRYVVETLNDDLVSRQAVITIWRPNPRKSVDIPCTVSLQFLVRDGKLHCIANMRSSDVWLGLPYDMFNFSMIAAYVALQVNAKPWLGTLVINAGSQHLYESNRVMARDILLQPGVIGDFTSMSLQRFNNPVSLMNGLATVMGIRDDDVPPPFSHLRQHLLQK